MYSKQLAIIGAGGFGREIACLIKILNNIENRWNFIGYYDDFLPIGYRNKYGKVIGSVNDLNQIQNPIDVIIGIANPGKIRLIANSLNNPNISFPNIFAPNTNIFDEETLQIGKGNLFFFGCRISTDVVVGDFNLMNGAVSLGHDVSIGSFNVLGPSVRISGACKVGDENFFGVNSVVLQGNNIGSHTRIGAGAVIIRNTKDHQLYVGNPAIKAKL